MILYHGTNQDIENIDLTKGLKHKDFGMGFYLTSDSLQLTNYHEGIYTSEQASKLLQDKYLDQQYYFGTEAALRFLHKKSAEIV